MLNLTEQELILVALEAKAKEQYPAVTDKQLADATFNADESGFAVDSSDYADIFISSVESYVKPV